MQKRLLSRSWPLWFNRYAQANRSQEDPQVGGQTLQDYRPGEDFAGAKLAPPLAHGKKSEAQTSARQGRARRQNRRGADQKQPAVCLARLAISSGTLVSLWARLGLVPAVCCSAACCGNRCSLSDLRTANRHNHRAGRGDKAHDCPQSCMRIEEARATAGPAISWRHANRTRQRCQTAGGLRKPIAQCSTLLRTSLQVNFCSVRSCGLRTDKPRQGRNAATVV